MKIFMSQQELLKKFKNISCGDKTDKCKNCTGGCRARALKLNGNICCKDDVYCILKGVEK